ILTPTRPATTVVGSEHAASVRSGLPGRQVARGRRRALDAAHRARPATRPRALCGSADLAGRDRAEPAFRAAPGEGGARPDRTPPLLRAPAAGRVPPERQGPRARRGGRRAGTVGHPSSPSRAPPGQRGVRPPGEARLLLP